MKIENTLKSLYYKEESGYYREKYRDITGHVGRTQINYRVRELVGEKGNGFGG